MRQTRVLMSETHANTFASLLRRTISRHIFATFSFLHVFTRHICVFIRGRLKECTLFQNLPSLPAAETTGAVKYGIIRVVKLITISNARHWILVAAVKKKENSRLPSQLLTFAYGASYKWLALQHVGASKPDRTISPSRSYTSSIKKYALSKVCASN